MQIQIEIHCLIQASLTSADLAMRVLRMVMRRPRPSCGGLAGNSQLQPVAQSRPFRGEVRRACARVRGADSGKIYLHMASQSFRHPLTIFNTSSIGFGLVHAA